MPTKMSIAEAREKLTSLAHQFEQVPEEDVVVVTRHNLPVLAIMPWDLYESIVETLEVMSDPVFMAELRQSISEQLAGDTVSWEKAKKDLGL